MYSMFPQNQLFRPGPQNLPPAVRFQKRSITEKQQSPKNNDNLVSIISGHKRQHPKSHINSGLLAEASNTHRHYMKKDRNPQQRNIKPWCCECFPQTYLTYRRLIRILSILRPPLYHSHENYTFHSCQNKEITSYTKNP